MVMFGIGTASPSKFLSSPAMIFKRLDLPEPLRPRTPILAPGKNDSEMSFKIWRFGGTTLPTRCIVYTYWAMEARSERGKVGNHSGMTRCTSNVPPNFLHL